MQTFHNKLLQYSALAAGLISFSEEIKSQVIYTDIDPDIVLDSIPEYAEIDIDADGIMNIDFKKLSFDFYTSSLSITHKGIFVGPHDNANLINGFAIDYYYYYSRFLPYALPHGALIDSGVIWQNKYFQTMNVFEFIGGLGPAGQWGYWNDVQNHYLGIKFINTDFDIHYGWIRCSVVNAGKTLIIKDYAYESEVNHGIIAGDTVKYVGIPDLNSTRPKVYCSDMQIHILFPEYDEFIAIIYTIDGRRVFEKEYAGTEFPVDPGLHVGTYIVQLITQEGMNYSVPVILK